MIKIAIFGYGNLGHGVEKAVLRSNDCKLFGVFTRRKRTAVETQSGVPVYGASELLEIDEGAVDVVIICAGSPDLPELTPKIVSKFCTADGFDIHEKIPAYCTAVDGVAQRRQKTAVVAGGWDPGLFSLQRAILQSVMPEGKSYTFWGKGVSQGHTQAIKWVDGVLDGVQYTLPRDSMIERIHKGETPDLSPREMHERVCFVVEKKGADREKIESDIKNMPDYFKGYTTSVYFVTEEILKKEHSGFAHGGKVIRKGKTGDFSEFSLSLSSNPDFTGEALLSCARAAHRLYKKGEFGAKTVLDIPPSYYLEKNREQLIKTLL